MQWKMLEKRRVFLSEGSVDMGNIREWSNIFDLLYGAEFFSAVLYDDEKKDDDNEEYTSALFADDSFKVKKHMAQYGEGKKLGLYESMAISYAMENRAQQRNFVMYTPFFGGEYEEKLLNEKALNEKMLSLPEKVLNEKTLSLPEKAKSEAVCAFFEAESYRGYENVIFDLLENSQSSAVNSIDSIKIVGKRKLDRILDINGEMLAQGAGNVKIEVTNNNTVEKESDIDTISDKLTQKLYELMSRGADGLY